MLESVKRFLTSLGGIILAPIVVFVIAAFLLGLAALFKLFQFLLFTALLSLSWIWQLGAPFLLISLLFDWFGDENRDSKVNGSRFLPELDNWSLGLGYGAVLVLVGWLVYRRVPVLTGSPEGIFEGLFDLAIIDGRLVGLAVVVYLIEVLSS